MLEAELTRFNGEIEGLGLDGLVVAEGGGIEVGGGEGLGAQLFEGGNWGWGDGVVVVWG